MFANLDGMINLSNQMYTEFKSILEGWNRRKTMIGHSMAKYSRFLIIYNEYLVNLAQTQSKIKRLLEEKPQAKLIQKELSTEHKIIHIADLIIKPFQRPLKYHLLLKDYCEKTDATHPDYLNLKEAIICYQKVNEKNN